MFQGLFQQNQVLSELSVSWGCFNVCVGKIVYFPACLRSTIKWGTVMIGQSRDFSCLLTNFPRGRIKKKHCTQPKHSSKKISQLRKDQAQRQIQLPFLSSIFGKFYALQRLCRSKKCKLLRKWEVKKWECYLLFEIEWTVNGSFYSRGYFHSGKIPHENSWEILLG